MLLSVCVCVNFFLFHEANKREFLEEEENNNSMSLIAFNGENNKKKRL